VLVAGQDLAELVRDELREPVAQLVRDVVVALVREELSNGAAPALVKAEIESSTNGATSTATKVCKTCSRELPEAAFEPHRRECRQCRRGRERRAATPTPDAAEPPRSEETAAASAG
jgi:hypothetical protein